MKLKEFMALCEPGTEITCWDKDVDSEFYFYTKEEGKKSRLDEEFPNVDKCEKMLAEHLDIVKIHDGGIEVNLYELLENPKIIEFAKKNMFEEHQYEDDGDVVMMLFDDNVNNISQGFEGFSELMVQCLTEAFGEGLEKCFEFENSPLKMKYGDMIKFLNDNGILLMQPVIADTVDTLLPIGWTGTEEYYEELCEKSFDAYLAYGDERDHWDIVKEVLEEEFNKEESLDDVIRSCEEVSKGENRDKTEKGTIDKEER